MIHYSGTTTEMNAREIVMKLTSVSLVFAVLASGAIAENEQKL